MGSAANPGQIGSTQAERDEIERKKAADAALYGADGPGKTTINNQGDGGWVGGPVGTITKAALSSPGDLINHTGSAVIDAAQGDFSGAGKNLVSAGRDAGNVASGGTLAPVIGSSDNPNGGPLGSTVTAISDGKAPPVPNIGITSGAAPGANPTATADAAAARASRDQLLKNYEDPTARPVPTTSAPSIAPLTKVAPTTVGPATAVAPVTVGAAGQAGPAPAAVAGKIAPTTVGPAATYSASTIAPTAGAQAGAVTAATLNTTPQDQVRARQLQLLDSLDQASQGKGPSAAQAQLQKANDAAIQTQQSLAAGAHGTSRLTQRLLADSNIADLTQKNAADSAILKAQEQNTARQQLLTGLEGTRGADVTVAGKQADLTQGANLLGAQLNTNVSISNADRDAARNMKDAELHQAADAGNAAAINELKERQAQITSSEGIAGAANETDVSKANAGNAVTVDVANMQAKNRMTELQAQIDSAGGIATAQQKNEMDRLQATLTADANKTDANNANDLAKTKAQAELQTNIANLDASLKSRGLDDAQRTAQLNAYIQQQADILGWDKSEATNAIEKYKADQELKGAIVGGAGATLATLLKSDRRAKTDITPLYSDGRGKTDKKALLDHYDGGGGEVEDLLDKLHPVKFKYKDPGAEGAAPGERYGIIAQDLEKSPMGRSLVVDDGGVKKIDTAQAVGALLAAMSRMNQRVKRVEGRRA